VSELRGRKLLLLFPPSQSFHLYPFPVHHTKGKDFAMADVEDPDVARFPALSRARGVEVLLNEGEVLHLPARWWHYVRQLGPGEENLSLNFWALPEGGSDQSTAERLQSALAGAHAPPSARELRAAAAAAAAAAGGSARARHERAQADDALLAEMGEADGQFWCHLAVIVEGIAVDHFGGEKAGSFLTDLAVGADAAGGAWPAASPLREAAQTIRSQLHAVLGADRANVLLRLLTRDGRLHPGLAPPVSGPVVDAEAGQHTSREERERMRAIAAGAAVKGGSPFL
jgi:hypothetical protein